MVMEGPVVGSARLTPEEERTVIRDITVAAESQCKEGDNFYLITHRWWQHWLDYVNQDFSSTQNNGSPPNTSHCSDSAHSFDSKRPSVIDNTNLIYEVTSEISNFGIELHDTLVEGQDYILLPQDVWKQLHGWYGGGPVLPRKAISTGISHSELAIEVYELRLQLLVEPKGDHGVIRISKKETIGELHKKACEIFDLILDQVCIWDYYGHQKHALMDNMEKTLDDSNIQMDQDMCLHHTSSASILVEVLSDGMKLNGFVGSVRENGSIGRHSTAVLLEHSTSNLPAAGASSTSKAICRSGSSEPAHGQFLTTPSNDFDTFQGSNCIGTRSSSSGLTGLLNLGNTCFMNSAIQCLVHTPEFARYFREDYRQEINWQNPLGMVGELALAFGELLRKLWAPGRTPVSPRPFKAKLARFAPQFSGYNQHDSQELLAFLLDGLHEDLNRVKHKPYIKTNDADGRPDEEVADEYWQNHISRNDSIIVDVCQGQYKSTLVCPVCEKVSVTFDPFMYLSLPLQFATSRPMTVTVFTSDGSASPSYCTVSVPKHGRCKDLIRALSNASAVKAGEKLLVAEIRGHLIHRFLDDPLILLSTIKDDDHLVAYKVLDVSGNSILLQLIHRLEERDFSSSKGAVVLKPYGTPLITQIACDDHITGGDIQKIVRLMLSAWLKSEESHTISGNCIPSAARASQDISSSKDMLLSESSACQDQDGPKLTMDFILPLHIVDGNKASFDLSTEEAQSTKLSFSSTSLVVYMNWSTNDFEKYDSHSLESLPEVLKYAPAQKKSRNEPLSLYACMEAFLREEPLVPEDMWYCPQCKKQRQASKKLDLWRLPEVLVIHLKRFSYSRSNKHKLETFVNFPIHDFDLANYVASKKISDQLRYELYALSNHYGSMASGHYTAHIKLLDENRWYNFDDNHISPINEEDVKSAAAYVLFYRRVKSHGSAVNYGSQSYVDQNSNTSRR